jgi:hypothetical protein
MSEIKIYGKVVGRENGWFFQVTRDSKHGGGFKSYDVLCYDPVNPGYTIIRRPDGNVVTFKAATRSGLREAIRKFNRVQGPQYKIVGGLH